MPEIHLFILTLHFSFPTIENAKSRSTLNDMITEAHAIREDLVYRQQMSNSSQASRQPGQGHTEETDDDEINTRTIKECPAETGTLVPERNNGDGTMIAHEDYGTLVPDSGTMVELESNLGTMVINSDSEDSTMKSAFSYRAFVHNIK